MGKLGEAVLAESVIGALAGRQEARHELRRLAEEGDTRAVIPLAARLEDQDAELRLAACEALAAIGDASVAEALVHALTRLGEGRLARGYAKAMSGCVAGREELRCLAAEGDLRSAAPLIALLGHTDPALSSAAAEALRSLGPWVSKLLADRLADDETSTIRELRPMLPWLSDSADPQVQHTFCRHHFTRFEISPPRCRPSALVGLWRAASARSQRERFST
ncbi:MAG: hypothetical protein COZ06_06545 [Armatimonadetes bacterium CG_4_10_14_3_um_filter_66_18]|nr:HEAT repeat domain-containing protein [Armatimonadota bacterium]OIO95984.1 MAG: hypothetical protein AUJ96_25660 [Armatimonadetes bacterium CG2_30_66_41]PIU94571.1 MAG: hypothetical protein COS65_06965 [Armatimonadetes bacterium CG06_land_8_20_14_3_00_66_21]PIX43541.1 MAG: hypothetical protein COZ57_19060 [Armatimonadetes bacterium CG_4_8_14_3_um_filter_66_20]PIY50984.1 MAG: hypothetical protein COZ06_06545 [Armatimonadetes bacterium CG_4_10_14_3_um_filter_66_18]PJB69065.1 MAG: hypothetical